MRSLLRHLFYSMAPERVLRMHVARRLAGRARDLSANASGITDPEMLVRTLWPYFEFRPIQIESEIIRLLERVLILKPRTVLEIGAASGGTTFLFSRIVESGSTIVSIDLAFDKVRTEAVRTIAAPSVRLHTLCRDSHADSTLQEVRTLLRSPLDLLFIDGDHSYEGVRSDYEMYSPLVRPDGLIVFHDIVPDLRMRTGTPSHVDVGGVPHFWRELKASRGGTEEIVEDPDQDGYGIGLLRV
jgi:predicted O-methyltransferase YrrM